MKHLKIVYLLLVIFIGQSINVYSQISNNELDLILVREDKVIPSLSSEYESFLADAKKYFEDNKTKNFNYFTLMQDNYTFRHITPINDLNDINYSTPGSLSKKVNKPELNLILESMNSSLSSSKHIILKYLASISFIPDGDSWGVENSYRKWGYYYFYPGSEKEVEKILASWRDLYKRKNAKMGFRVFKSFIGEEKPLYIFATWGKNPVNYQENLNELSNLLGEEGAALWMKMMEFVRETRNEEGWYLPQYSYAPGMKFAE